MKNDVEQEVLVTDELKEKAHPRLKSIWHHMKGRCYNPDCNTYRLYGGRGITVCDEWKNSLATFEEWALQNGYDPDAKPSDCTIDRIDVNGNYEPNNCRWISMKMQSRNRQNTVRIEYNGENISWQDFVDQTGITIDSFVRRRVIAGMSADEILEEWGYKTDKEHYMTEIEAMRYYKTNGSSILRWLNDGRLQGVKFKSGVYIRRGQEVKRRRKVSQDEKNEIYQLHLQGKKTKELMELFDLSRPGVQNIVRTMERQEYGTAECQQ